MDNKMKISKIQYGIYVDSVADEKSTMYNLPFLIDATKLDTDKLIAAVNNVIKNHKVLSTKIETEDSSGNIYLCPLDKDITVEVINVNKSRFNKANLVRPFNLHGGALSRFELYKVEEKAYLFYDIHHIIMDGMSIDLMNKDIEDEYRNGKEDKENISFFDYLNKINDEKFIKENDKKKEDDFKYYDTYINDIDPDNLPLRDNYLDKPVEKWLDREFSIDLEKLGKEVSISTFLPTAFAFLFAKFNAINSIIINNVHNGRNDEVKNTYGMFVKTHPIAFSYNSDDNIKEVLIKNDKSLKELRNINAVSLQELKDKYGVNNEIVFAYQGDVTNFSLFEKEGCVTERVTDANHIDNAKTTCQVRKISNNKFNLQIGYRFDYFTDAFANSLADSYIKVLSELVNKNKFSEVEIADEKAMKLLDTFHGDKLKYDTNETIVSMFNKQVMRVPNNECIVGKNKSYTYKEVDEYTNKYANFLIDSGITENDVVGVLLDRVEEYPMLCIAISKTRATYLPMDPAYPEDRLAFMLKDSGAKILFTNKELQEKVKNNFIGKIVLIDEEHKEINNVNKVDRKVLPSDRFIMLYTSGTTGTPKGVELLNSNIVATTIYTNYLRKDDGVQRFAAYASFGFDASMHEIYPPLVTGGVVFIIPDDIRLDLYAIRDYYNKNKITHGFMTTQVARQFIELDDIKYLKEFSCGGEKLASVKPPKFKLHNCYGPTECSMYCTCFLVDKEYKDIPIGKSNANTDCYIIDKDNHRVPVGACGELIITGPQVAKGYLNRPDKNAEAFKGNPFSKEPGYDKAYYTGDVVRFLPDGNIQYVGRRDMQVKVRGFRIELSEVEEVIRRFKGIKDVTVAAFDDVNGLKYLVAYVVSDSKVDVKELNSFIMKEKPSYMVPAVTMQIDRIPLTQNSKVNKRALPKPEAPSDAEIKTPSNKKQEKIFDIISSVIGHKNFGVDTDIFLAGLNSISVVRLNVLLGKEFNVPIRMNDIKENNTVEKIEKFLENGNDLNINKTEIKLDKYPLSKTQEGILVECLANPGTTIYNIPILLKISDEINVDKLESAIKVAIDAHPYLRAIINMDNESGDIYVKRDENKEYNIEIKNVDKLDPITTLTKPFSITGKILYRVRIYNTKNEGKYLFIDTHHIISDGTSLSIFLKDIENAYYDKKVEAEQFSGFSYAVEEKKLLEGEGYKKAKEYYENLFKGVDVESLPPKDDTDGEVRASNLIKKLTVNRSEVEEYCKNHGISLNAFFNAAFSITLSKYDYKEEFAYTTFYNGRNDSRINNAICMLVKTLPIICKYDKDTTILDFLKGYTSQLFDSMTNDIYSFAEVSRTFGLKADVMFAYQGDNFNFDNFCGKKSTLIDIPATTAKEPFSLYLHEINNEFVAKSEFRHDYYKDETIDGFIECMDQVAKEFLKKQKISEISLLTDRTRELLKKFNDTSQAVDNTNAAKKFEEAVEKYKDKTALIAKDETLTFDELNKRANRVAHSLIKEGVVVDNFVGLMMERCANAYVGREGIMKSGGAFLALDPKYPDDRVSYIINDSKAKLIVTKKDIAEKRKDLFNSLGLKVLLMEDLLKNPTDTNPNVDIKPNNLAYCLYTSGSTGNPKGVMVEHHGLVNLATDGDKSVQVRVFTIDCKCILALAALTFDVSVGEHVIGLHNGITVALASEDEITNPLLLCEMIKKNGVDGFTCTPSYINNMLDIEETYDALRQIKGFQIGAETFPKQLYRKMRDNGINARITNSYGPTEATDYTTTNFVESDEHITIGRPLPNYTVDIFDKFGNILPPKIPGELIIGGIGVARGYVGREDLNKEKYFEKDGVKYYHSGDLSKWNYQGTIDFLGRMDNQVKLHGLRIELDEISNVINTYEGVKQSIALVKTNTDGEEYLAAYFIASNKVDIDKLYEHIKKKLTEYMIPATMMQLDAFPMNANGKVDKKALPEPGVKQEKKEVKGSETKLQETILDMFRRALNKQDVGIDDDFFKVGGTSLSASKIAMRAMTLKIPITYGDVFDYPTVVGLEKLVLSKQGGENFADNTNDNNLGNKNNTSTKKQDKEIKNNITNLNNESSDKPEVKEALKNNIAAKVDEIKYTEYGDVLLTGCTGFLGIHVLKYLLDKTDKKVYCFIRKGKMSSLQAKLMNYLMYYFDDPMEDLFGKRIFLIAGDITEKDKVDFLVNYEFDTMINCAAIVKHFGNDDSINKVNVEGVKNLVDFCVKNNKRLIHISTASVAGTTVEGTDLADKVINESVLNIGQDISNKYVHTKFLAEEAILTAVTNNKLKAKIIRVGNLMSRYSDGEFQINSIENAFMKRLKAFVAMKSFPMSIMDEVVEFSPIDCVAETICRLAGTNDEFTVYLSCNEHYVQMADVIYAMNNLGFNINVVDDEEYNKTLFSFMEDEKKNDLVSVLISYDQDVKKKTVFIGYENKFTNKALYRIKYRWPIIDEDYIEKGLGALKSLGYFDINKN